MSPNILGLQCPDFLIRLLHYRNNQPGPAWSKYFSNSAPVKIRGCVRLAKPGSTPGFLEPGLLGMPVIFFFLAGGGGGEGVKGLGVLAGFHVPCLGV